MKKCIVYGNCQITPVKNHLMTSPTFQQNYYFYDIPPIHKMDKDSHIDPEVLADCELFIYQRVKPSYSRKLNTNYLLTLLPRSCQKINYSYCYFTGYYPQIRVDHGLYYKDTNVIRLLKEGWNKQEIISRVNDPSFYSNSIVQANLKHTFKELRKREEGLDVPVADFIEAHYQRVPFFYTYNHPTCYLTHYISQKIAERMGISPLEILQVSYEPYAREFIHPIYPSIMELLQLPFIQPTDRAFAINHTMFTFEDMNVYIDSLMELEDDHLLDL